MHAYRESSASVFFAVSQGALKRSNCILAPKSVAWIFADYVRLSSLHVCKSSSALHANHSLQSAIRSKKTCPFWPDYVGKKICVKTSNLGFSFTTWNLLLHYIISQQEMALLKFTSPSLSSLTASKCMTRLSHWNNPVWARVSLAATGQENPACLGRSCPCAAWDSQHKPDDRTQGMPDRCRLSWSKYLTRLRLVNTVNLNLQA